LFNRTIRDNIALTDPAMAMERVVVAAKLAGAHEFILELPNGYDTMVGERGASLSGGQRQRIAIARALVGDPRILIFDEATSALDYESERVVQESMRSIVKGRTVLIIAHRLSTVRNADRIIALERGRLVEDGSHDELLRRGGRYAHLHRLQAGGGAPFGQDDAVAGPGGAPPYPASAHHSPAASAPDAPSPGDMPAHIAAAALRRDQGEHEQLHAG
jgi:ATP-binding cassette, subfamily B, bacterial HlyB/CyaB